MKRKRLCILLLAVGAWTSGFAQLTIEECYRKAQANYPLIRQYELIEKTAAYNVENAARGYLPQLAFSAQATYQSDVTKIPIDFQQLGLAGIRIPTLSQDQYKAEVSLSQTVWDGGAIRSQKEVLRAQADVERKDLDVGLYALNERVNQLFFGILLADAQLAQNRTLQADLRQHCSQVEAYVRNGIAGQADADALRVGLLQAQQAEAQLRHTRRAYVAMLSQFIGEPLADSTALVRPAVPQRAFLGNRRPELALYDAKIRSLQAQNTQLTAGLMPRLGLFVNGGYGKPGLDMFENEFKPYYVAGVCFSWNISSFWTRGNNRRKIQEGIRSVEAQRATFLFNTSLDAAQRDADIDRYRDQLKYDDEIIALRTAVRKASEAKMAGGTLSGDDLARDILAEQNARQDKIVHEISLLLAVYNRKYVTNH